MCVVKQFEGPICFTRIARRANKLHMQAYTAPVSSAMGLLEILVYVRNINGGSAHLRDSTNVDRPRGRHGDMVGYRHTRTALWYTMDWWLERRRLM